MCLQIHNDTPLSAQTHKRNLRQAPGALQNRPVSHEDQSRCLRRQTATGSPGRSRAPRPSGLRGAPSCSAARGTSTACTARLGRRLASHRRSSCSRTATHYHHSRAASAIKQSVRNTPGKHVILRWGLLSCTDHQVAIPDPEHDVVVLGLRAVHRHVPRVADLRVCLPEVLLRVQRVEAHACRRPIDQDRPVARALQIDLSGRARVRRGNDRLYYKINILQ